MSEVTELLEKMEHAGHSGGGHGHGGHDKAGPGKAIGITMAILGVMLAFCAAMVGGERTELMKTMVEQSVKWGIYQSETTKFRVIEGDLEMLKALTPSKEEADKLDETLRSKRAPSGKSDDEDTAEMKDLIASSIDDMADLLSPDKEDVDHFTHLSRVYEHDVKEAKEDAEAYESAVHAHERAAELYERAQLLAEIGIVIASVALLMASRKVWALSVACGAIGAVVIAYTAWTTHVALQKADADIVEAAKREQVLDEDEDQGDAKEGNKPADAKPDTEKPDKAEKPDKTEGAPAADKAAKPAPKPSPKPAGTVHDWLGRGH